MRVTLKNGFVATSAYTNHGQIVLKGERGAIALTPMEYAQQWASGVLSSLQRTDQGLCDVTHIPDLSLAA